MSQPSQPIEKIDLSPQLKRPLQLWNPLDYLLLLYWVFYFPQALLWYEDKWSDGESLRDKKTWGEKWQWLQNNPIIFQFWLQGIFLTIIVPLLISYGLQQFGLEIDWGGVAVGVLVGVAAGVALGVLVGVAVGVLVGVAVSVAGGALVGVAGGVAVGVVGGVAVGLAFGVLIGVAGSVAIGLTGGVVGGVTVGVGVTRVDDWLVSQVPVPFRQRKKRGEVLYSP